MSNPVIYNTGDQTNYFQNILVFGFSGSGKTPLAITCPDVIIISTEPGLLSLSRYRLPFITVLSYEEAIEAHKWATQSAEARKFQTIFFDSISALSERILLTQRRKNRDARQYSPMVVEQVNEITLLYQGIRNKHVVMTSKAIIDSQTGKIQCFAAQPKLGPSLPYHFDNVLFLERFVIPDPQTGIGIERPFFCCRANERCEVTRNRLGMLELWEPADIGYIINKSNGVVSK